VNFPLQDLNDLIFSKFKGLTGSWYLLAMVVEPWDLQVTHLEAREHLHMLHQDHHEHRIHTSQVILEPQLGLRPLVHLIHIPSVVGNRLHGVHRLGRRLHTVGDEHQHGVPIRRPPICMQLVRAVVAAALGVKRPPQPQA
jgi:hypothetical protein